MNIITAPQFFTEKPRKTQETWQVDDDQVDYYASP